MWCERCRKNVTGAVSGQHDSICCAHCGASLPGGLPSGPAEAKQAPLPRPAADVATKSGDAGAPASQLAEAVSPQNATPVAAVPSQSVQRGLREPLLALESWEIDEDLRHMQRLLRGRRFGEPATDTQQSRFDAAHASTAISSTDTTSGASGGMWSMLGGMLAKCLLLTGVTTLACGVALLAWWQFGLRADLCTPGLAATIAGLFLVMIGLAWQPDRDAAKPAPPPARRTLSEHPLLYADLNQDLDARITK